MPHQRSYVILATPRSGSNWFCEVLSTIGTLGRPEEYFWPGWRTRWTELAFPQFLERVLEAGTTSNGVFGLKLMWYQIEALLPELGAMFGQPDAAAGELLKLAFADPMYLLLTRRDRLRQAISLERAIQSEIWRSTDRSTNHAQPEYRRDHIDEHLAFLDAEEGRYRHFCASQGASWTTLEYEDVVAKPGAAVHTVQRLLGLPPQPINLRERTRHEIQADAINQEWVHRYHLGQSEECVTGSEA